MSTTILDTPSLAIARCASSCERCAGKRGECVQFVCGRGDTHTYTLCIDCFRQLVRAINSERKFQP